ncbi:hypothetical protein D3C73_1130280 [compost metagenome]
MLIGDEPFREVQRKPGLVVSDRLDRFYVRVVVPRPPKQLRAETGQQRTVICLSFA